MTTRRFDIDAGFATSTLPTAEDAVSADDTPTFGQVALKTSWGDHVDNITAVKAIAAADRADGQVVSIDGQVLYQFDSDSAAVADDDLILQPNAGSGRWHKVTSGGSGSASGESVESIEQHCDLKHSGVHVQPYDIAVCQTFDVEGPTVEGFLLDTLTSGSSSIALAWNPKFLDSSNKNSDFEAGFAAVSGTDTSNIDTTTTRKIGSSATSFNKGAGTSVNCFIQHDLGAGNGISLAGHRQVLVFVNMPSVTNLSTISIRLSDSADNPANYEQYNASVQFDGSTFQAGWNLVGFDLDGASSTTGTGWSPESNLLRTFAIGVVTSSAAQTYAEIVFDSLVFVEDAGETVTPSYKRIAQPGMAYTITDTSNREQIIISSAATRVIGNTTLSANATNTYAGGTASVVMRSQLGITGDNRSYFQTTSPLLGATLNSGASELAHDVRVSKILKESLTNATVKTTVALDTELYFEVIDTPTATTITVEDTVDYSAEILDTNTMHVVYVYDNNGKRNYVYSGSDITLTANSSWLSNVLTLTASSGDVTVIDNAIAAASAVMLVKAGQLEAFLSCVAATANESFSSLTTDELIVTDVGLPYPLANKVWGHWYLGGRTQAEALKNRKGSASDFSVSGTYPTSTREFKNGQFGAGVFSNPNYVYITNPNEADPDSTKSGGIAGSIWFYPTAALSSNNVLISKHNTTTTGWLLYAESGGLKWQVNSTVTSVAGTINIGQWNHVFFVIVDNAYSACYLNGVVTAGGTTAIGATSNDLRISYASTNDADQLYLADAVLWTGISSTDITGSLVNSIYASGRHRVLGNKAAFTYRYESTALSGQKLSVRAQLNRETNAVEPFVTRVAAIKTN